MGMGTVLLATLGWAGAPDDFEKVKGRPFTLSLEQEDRIGVPYHSPLVTDLWILIRTRVQSRTQTQTQTRSKLIRPAFRLLIYHDICTVHNIVSEIEYLCPGHFLSPYSKCPYNVQHTSGRRNNSSRSRAIKHTPGRAVRSTSWARLAHGSQGDIRNCDD